MILLQTMCELITFSTPKGVILYGIWLGPEHPKRIFIMIHGLGSSMFSNHNYLLPLVNTHTAVMYFNNRGHDIIARIKKRDKRKKTGYSSFMGGAAHEVFTDCTDDIQGAIREAEKRGVRCIFLVGHSTGCQKIAYYLSRRKHTEISGAVLLSPMSDYAAAVKYDVDKKLAKKLEIAKKFIEEGKPHALLPLDIFKEVYNAQRFVSLYSPDSAEEIFCYGQKGKKPNSFMRIKERLLIILAQKDEYRDRSMKKIASWFSCFTKAPHRIEIIADASHNFYAKEDEIAKSIKRWVANL